MNEVVRAFDSVADEYLRARSQYPQALFDRIFETAKLTSDAKVLDVGCGSGQATLEFARRGCQVSGLDPAKNALDLLTNLSDKLPVSLIHSSFEDYREASRFDLVACAQAFHWLNPLSAPDKIADLLKPRGHCALFWHLQDITPDSPQAQLYVLSSKYFKSFPVMNPPEYGGEFVQAMANVLSQSKHFEEPEISEFPWVQSYEPDMFKTLFRSASNYSKLDLDTKYKIDEELDEYVRQLNSEPTINYRTCLIEARVRDA